MALQALRYDLRRQAGVLVLTAIVGVLLLVLTASTAVAQQVGASRGDDWRRMATEDAIKVLTSSPWSQIQADTDTTEMFFSPTRPGTPSLLSDTLLPNRQNDQQIRNNTRADRGALNQAVSVHYYVRFFSSRPVREAISRIVLLKHPEPGPALVREWQGFVERDFGPYIVVSVTCGSPDGRLLGPNLQAFDSATAASLKNTTYLERNDGKRVWLIDYRPPGPDGLGAKFIFPRFVDGERYLITPKGTVRFATEIGPAVKINVKFNLTDMVFGDRLEY